MKTAFNSNTRFLMGGSYKGGREWSRYSNEQDKCFKIYYFKAGRSFIQSCDNRFELSPEKVYFLNGYSLVSQECPEFMSVAWFHFQLESLYLEKTLKTASCVASFDIQKLASFLHVFDKLDNYFHNRSSVQEERIATLEIQSLIQFIIARMIEEKRIDISMDNHNINRLIPALDYINENYRSNVSLAELAELCHYSPNYFNRLFRNTLNMTPINYVQQRRMEDATRLLVYTDKQVKEVARETGYEDPAYFSRLFVQTYKMSPGSYRTYKQRKMP